MQDIPSYRIERYAEEDATWQWLVNGLRRLCFLPITKTSEQRKREVLLRYEKEAPEERALVAPQEAGGQPKD